MIALTAILRVKPGHEDAVKTALLQVVAHARENEPETISYYAGQSAKEPQVFNTYERYADMAALERHNNSAAVAEFFALAQPLLDGEPIVEISREIAVK
ncbi:MAG: putative quinol monooxygenase [Sneathiellaceae bacterium]